MRYADDNVVKVDITEIYFGINVNQVYMVLQYRHLLRQCSRECICIQLLHLNLKMRSRCSSSSSGSLKLIPDAVMETKMLLKNTCRDLFDELLDQNFSWQNNQDILRTISQLNLSPRSQNHSGCKCTKIDCLKMYCECFSKGRLCNQKCECNACCNKAECQLHIYKAQQMANYRHPGTFKGVPAFVPLRRCTCKKSACRKNYCECYRAGMKCTQDCECLDCHNGKPHPHDDYLDSWMQIEVNA